MDMPEGEGGRLTWEAQGGRWYEEAESSTAKAWEDVVRRDSFGEVLARLTENVMGMTRISNDAFDLLVRNLRIAGRRDITRLATQLARTEDKLELVLQEGEALRSEVAAGRAADAGPNGSHASSSPGARRRSSARSAS